MLITGIPLSTQKTGFSTQNNYKNTDVDSICKLFTGLLTCTPLMAPALPRHLPQCSARPPVDERMVRFQCRHWNKLNATCLYMKTELGYEFSITSSASSSFFFLLSGMRSSSQLNSLLVKIQSISFLMNTKASTCKRSKNCCKLHKGMWFRTTWVCYQKENNDWTFAVLKSD